MDLLGWRFSSGTLALKIRSCRLGKLRITKSGRGTIEIDSTNVRQFTMGWKGNSSTRVIDIEGQAVNSAEGEPFLRFRKDSEDTWRVRRVLLSICHLNRPFQITYPEDHAPDIQPSGRLSLILSSQTPILFVIPDEDDMSLSYALRLAHDLDTFHKLDAEVLTDAEAGDLLERGSLGPSNIVILDGPNKTSFGRRLLKGPNHPLFPPRVYRSRAKSNGAGPVGDDPAGD